jgi:hypothetical protein
VEPVLGLEESCPLLRKPQKLGAEVLVLGLEESSPLLRKPLKPRAEAPEQEEGLELQREPQEEQPQLMKRAKKDIVKSKAKETKRSSCVKGRSKGATEASMDATYAGAWGDPP